MNTRVREIYKNLDRFIKNHCPTIQSKYIHLKKHHYKLLVESLSYREQCWATKNGYVTYRDFTIISEK